MFRTLKDFNKCSIGATDGDVGHVKDLYFDDHAWAIRYLIVDTGSWLSGRKVFISPISILDVDWPQQRLPASISRSQVEASPNINTEQPVSRQQELHYLGYYGYPNYWSGSGLWGDSMFPMTMYPGNAAFVNGAFERERSIEANADLERAKRSGDDPNLRSCKAVIGYHLNATDGDVGYVEEFLVDDQTWAIRYLVVNTSNWWLGHKVLIAPPWIDGVQWPDQTVSVDLSREAVKDSPPYDPSDELDRSHETGLYTHYGRAPYWKANSPHERQG